MMDHYARRMALAKVQEQDRDDFERGWHHADLDLRYLGFVSEVARFSDGAYGDGYRARLVEAY